MNWFWGRRPRTALEILQGAVWTCRSCNKKHQGMFDLAVAAPAAWPHSENLSPNSALSCEGDFLSEDFCVLDGEHFMVRCVLEIPVHGLSEKFAFGCWGSLSRRNFDRYVDRFDSGAMQGEGPWTSWLCNRLPEFAVTEPVGCWMYPQLHRQRPVLRVADDSHPLAHAQEHGIEPEHVLELYQACGHTPAS